VPVQLRRRLHDVLFGRRDRRPRRELLIDVAGACNLRCPSCPVGNMGIVNPTGLIDKELFRQIIKKAASEYQLTLVSLFNWAEPMLHPELPELIRIVRSEGVDCAISSNLNLVRNLDDMMRAEPTHFRVSLSGFTQETYGRTHARGRIAKVKENMRAVSEAKRRVGNTRTDVQVYFHKYRDNLDEAEPMRAYATELGFSWLEHWAYYMPLEKLLDLAEDKLPEAERPFVENAFALPIKEALEAAKNYGETPCRLYERQIVLDLKGQLNLCCGVYDYKQNGGLGNFLDMTPEDIVRVKEGHPTCTRCMKQGVHLYGIYQELPALSAEYERLVKINLERSKRPVRSLPVI
jgi:MoaA/NifB/PqqE/SkfB family radical SAM enzyme